MRSSKKARKTRETSVSLTLSLDGKGKSSIKLPKELGFLSHMLELFSFYGMFDLKLAASGDVHVDVHHLNEDIAITLGQAFSKALKDKRIVRYSSKTVPMDGSLVRISLDVSGRSYLEFSAKPARFMEKSILKSAQGYNMNYARQFLKSFVNHFPITLHVDIIKADDVHHVLEAVFKGLGLCLGEATKILAKRKKVSSTKGKL